MNHINYLIEISKEFNKPLEDLLEEFKIKTSIEYSIYKIKSPTDEGIEEINCEVAYMMYLDNKYFPYKNSKVNNE